MRYLNSALGLAAAIAIAGCSGTGPGSSVSTLPAGGGQAVAGSVASPWSPVISAGNSMQRPQGVEVRPSTNAQRGGFYASEFRSSVSVYGYAPKPNNNNNPPVCSPPGNIFNVNGIAADSKGNLIVPGSTRPGGQHTTDWVVNVYQGAAQPTICGNLTASIPVTAGQPVDATSINAAKLPIAVSEINFTTKTGEVVLCSAATMSCGAPVTSTSITGYGAGVAMDLAGDCWLSTAKKVTNGIPSGFRLIYWQGCTGNGVVASGTNGQSSYGGLFIDGSGNIGSFDAFNSTLSVYSGCNPACTLVGRFRLNGQSFYGGLNGSGGKLAVGNATNGSVDVYNYDLSNFLLRYSFNAGLHRSRVVESGIFSPSNLRAHNAPQ